ncbi:GntR family transcriptional regulator [Streptomyces sp. NPDC098789]|uniref:GntR family transcriptional regulator n=1 Tax=Streptomyces sp. NPDC098789 TaxID=3366098 RepID=UPI0037F31D3F
MTLPRPEEQSLDQRPLHVRIAADLRDDIMNGELGPGARLPSTTHLKVRFDASSATVQKALGLLKEERLVIGRAGSAVIVREHRQRTIRPADSLSTGASADAPYPWLTDAAGPGAHAVSRLVEVREALPPADVALALGLGPDDRALLRHQLLRIDGEPAELVRSYYPLDIARGTALTEARKIKGGTPTLLAGLGFRPRLSVDRVSARIPTQEEHRALGLSSDLPVLRTLRTVFSDDRRPVEVTVMVKAGHLYELRYEFAPD